MLKNIDWTVRSGEHWAILGPNGAGKSTLLLAALGLIWPDQAGGGSIVWRPEGVEEKSPLAVRAASALISPQTQAWYVQNAGDLSGEDLLLCGLYGTPRLYRAATDEDRALVRTLAEDFKLSALLEMDLAAMSQGQLRRMLSDRVAGFDASVPAGPPSPQLAQARENGWLEADPDWLRPTDLGRRFTNDVIALFLADDA